jgi:hypothetical protein
VNPQTNGAVFRNSTIEIRSFAIFGYYALDVKA